MLGLRWFLGSQPESTAQRVVHFWQAGQHLSLGLVR